MPVSANSQEAIVCVDFFLSNFPAPNELVEKNTVSPSTVSFADGN